MKTYCSKRDHNVLTVNSVDTYSYVYHSLQQDTLKITHDSPCYLGLALIVPSGCLILLAAISLASDVHTAQI